LGIDPIYLAAGDVLHIVGKLLTRGYNFALDRIAIGGLQKKLCALKVSGVLVDGISGLPRGSPGRKKPFGCRPCGESQSIL
jgi:hypothetical protein